jgi:thiamine biosynthesis lipoprotein
VKQKSYSFKAMGSPCELHLYGRSISRLDALAKTARKEITRLECKYSRYREDSLTTRINRSAGNSDGMQVDDETASLLDYADTAHRESGGLFDITSGALRRAWDFKSGRLPEPGAIESLLTRVGWQRVLWKRPQIVLPIAGMEIDFGGYVKEYAADRIAALCRRSGARHGLIDLGGDFAVVGPHPDNRPWLVGVRHPRHPDTAMATVPLSEGGIASSGDYERFMIVDGKRYGHVLDPRTGWPVEGLASVSVAASHCLIAGTATTVAMLKGAVAGPAWLDDLGLPNLRMVPGGAITGTLALRCAD